MSALAQVDWPTALVAAVCAVLVAVAGGVATRTDGWYQRLRVPAWKPPDWAFGPVSNPPITARPTGTGAPDP